MRYHPFDALVELQTDYIRLDCAALHLARDLYPCLNVGRYVSQLDALAEDVADQRPGLSATLRYQAMCEVLTGAFGLRGHGDHYDPQNSYLNRVLDRRLGLPIILSVVWIEVGRRLKWPVSGVALPGHFLVRFDDPERFVLADPFSEGRLLSTEDCRRLIARHVDRPVKFSDKFLRPLDTRGILSRMLRHLRSLYLAEGDWQHLAGVLRRLAALEPRNGKHLQDLAAVHTRLGDVRGAYGYLHVYLKRQPRAHDHALVKGNLEQLEAAILALN